MRAGRGAAGSVWPGVRSGECGLDRENGGKEVCSSVCVCVEGGSEGGMEACGQDV